MAESIAEAESEFTKKPIGSDMFKQSVIQAQESANAQMTEEEITEQERSQQNIKQMTQDLIDGALTSQTSLKYNGNDVECNNIEDNST